LRVLQVGAGVRLMIYREGLLLAVLPQRTLDCCDSPASSQVIRALSWVMRPRAPVMMHGQMNVSRGFIYPSVGYASFALELNLKEATCGA
jgi:hypothetical protein